MTTLNLDPFYNIDVENAYIITLKNNPVSEMLSARCQASCNEVGMPYTVWSAFDGTTANTPNDIIIPDNLKNEIAKSPKLKQIKASANIAENQLRLEEKLINPGITLSAGVDQDPDIANYRFGISIPIPIWNQRQGQIGEAAAGYRELQAQYTDQELALRRDIESAFQRYLIAQQQVKTFESGLLSQAESVLKVAESAYRYGERGILEYLDAQRTFRMVRKDYLASKYDYIVAILEIEQLLGIDILENKI